MSQWGKNHRLYLVLNCPPPTRPQISFTFVEPTPFPSHFYTTSSKQKHLIARASWRSINLSYLSQFLFGYLQASSLSNVAPSHKTQYRIYGTSMPVNYEESVLITAGNLSNCNVTVTMSSIPIIIEHVENPNGVI